MAGNLDHAVDYSAGMLMEATHFADWLIIAPIILTIVGGALLLMLREKTKLHGALATLIMGLLVLVDALLLARVLDVGPIAMTMGRWLPPFGITFTVDAFGALMALISGVVALAVCIYSLVEISVTGRRFGFYPLLMLLMTGVTGSFLTGDIFNLYVWFEVMLISSFGLLILGGERIQLDGALKYAILNLLATTLFLIATGLLYGAVGSLNMADISLKLPAVQEAGAPIITIGALYFLAFAMKAAAFPLNFWLPASYHTPNIVVSALFGGILTKVGVYALIRTMILLLPDTRIILSEVIAWVAVFTMIFGALGTLAHNDIRRVFGYLVISGIGPMLVGVALGSEEAISGAIMYAVHSIIALTGLYLAFGILMRKNGGKYNLSDVGGGYKASDGLSILFLVLAFGIVGLPPFSGFWPKFILVDASIHAGHGWLAFAILFSGFLTTISVGRVWAHAFWRGGPIGTTDGQLGMPLQGLTRPVRSKTYLPVGALVVIVCLIGVFPSPLLSIVQSGTQSLLNPERYVSAVFSAATAQQKAKQAEKAQQPKDHEDTVKGHDTKTEPMKQEGAH
ncbi:Na+/H+ antiporter subunit D [Cohaesibacter sp. CAU 1516]|uniref:Na+/H+ antiporter subunit D n=1 Tax=Cohaesibacter sp. CAU 1516 TaxID=2576038 RepID=UPI0010FF5D32|nr:Na+/H+ antiporter subunit D [Cohaesibacter sp. CAU 1516]TLP44844.1 Na+/H+ antiporter subunit D [Cohaesibacter sp. CAU 1516]